MLYQITAPHFCAGFVVEGKAVIKAAPIIRKGVEGKWFPDAIKWANARGYRVRRVE